jgi:glycosyltransferase involved in cell wall biosynthesis
MPKVSVILTSFNHKKYICEAIDSILQQTFTDFELIIWDDASSDDSWYLINQQYTDTRIKAFRNEINKGPVFGVNKAISEIATGDYIAIHHSDDVWKLSKLEKQLDFLEANQEIGAVFTWANIINEQGEEKENDHFTQQNKTRWEWLKQLFTGENRLNHPSILIRKQCYHEAGLYRYSLAQTPDAEMWSRVLLKSPIHIIEEKLTKHRLFTDNSNTSGSRIDVKIRISNEWNIIRENFLSLTDFEDIIAIFPSLERYRNSAGFDNKFLLAMACLYECKQKNAWQLGLTWLFELVNDPVRYQKITELYAFYYADLIKLTAEFDVYGIESVSAAELQAEVEHLRTSNTWLESQCAAWENEATEREKANTWLESQRVAWEKTATEGKQYKILLASQNATLESQNASLESQNASLESQNASLESQNASLELQSAAWENIAMERYTLINTLYESHSWKLTRPLRFLARLVSKLKA